MTTLKNFAGLLLILILPTWSDQSSRGFRNMRLALTQLAEFAWQCATFPWHCGAWVVRQVGR